MPEYSETETRDFHVQLDRLPCMKTVTRDNGHSLTLQFSATDIDEEVQTTLQDLYPCATIQVQDTRRGGLDLSTNYGVQRCRGGFVNHFHAGGIKIIIKQPVKEGNLGCVSRVQHCSIDGNNLKWNRSEIVNEYVNLRDLTCALKMFFDTVCTDT